MDASSRFVRSTLLAAGAVAWFGCSSQQQVPAASQAAATPTTTQPPAPPETSFGSLTKAERRDTVGVEAMTLNGIRKSEAKASGGKTFLLLSFQGKSCKAQGMTAMTSVGADGLMARTEDTTWLTDGAGTRFTPGLPASSDATCQLAFEVPATAAGLLWHDGDKAVYTLEPRIARRASGAKS